MRRAIFLDRDGVINHMVYNPDYGLVDSPIKPSEFALLPGAGAGVKQINLLDFLAIVISNQPGIAKGKFSKILLDAITAKMHQTLNTQGAKIDAVYYCLHHPDAVLEEYRQNCQCRKPKPGLMEQAGRDWDINLSASYFVGDGITDMLAGRAAGTTCIYVGYRKAYILDEFYRKGVEPDFIVGSLLEATHVISMIENGEKASMLLHSKNPGGYLNRHIALKFNDRLYKENCMAYTTQYLSEARQILEQIDQDAIEKIVDLLVDLRQNQGRLFLLGSGGGAAHASHAVCDFRKICGIEAYAPTDNISELTARVNDDGWETVFANWLLGSHLDQGDMLFIFSVGGGDLERKVSPNIVMALQLAKRVGAKICGVVGRDGGYTAIVADACVVIPVINPGTVTPHTEAFQALVWHLLASHPRLKLQK